VFADGGRHSQKLEQRPLPMPGRAPTCRASRAFIAAQKHQLEVLSGTKIMGVWVRRTWKAQGDIWPRPSIKSAYTKISPVQMRPG